MALRHWVQLDGWTWEDMTVQAEVGLHISVPFMRFNPELFPAPMDARLDEIRKSNLQRVKMLEDAFDSAIAYRDARAAKMVHKSMCGGERCCQCWRVSARCLCILKTPRKFVTQFCPALSVKVGVGRRYGCTDVCGYFA